MTIALRLRQVVGARGDGFRATVPALDIAKGDRLAIVGPSGVGKSTILDIIAGILRPASAEAFQASDGDAVFDVAALWRANAANGLSAFRARMIGYVMQTGGLAPFLTLRENVALPFWRDGRTDGQGAVDAILAELGLEGLGDRKPHAVSVGQRQRAAIARALVAAPPAILADEPTAALDPMTADAAMTTLTAAASARAAAVVLVTHDRGLAERHGFQILECRAEGVGAAALDPRPAATT